MLRNVVLVNVDVIAERVQVTAKNKRRVHEAARVHKFAFLADLHLLHVEHEASVENLERDRTLTAEDEYLIVSDLIGKTHIARDPLGLVTKWLRNLLPNVLRDVVALNRVNDLTLVHPAAERKDEVILEAAECHA